ncbi:hypothetical protein [Vibrio cholerae]|uniref:hypothetical protein n=2 Tax=Vibrio cholerae TaxID=666 RepID=UPI00307FFF13
MKILNLSLMMSSLISIGSYAAGLAPGTVLDEKHQAKTHPLVENFVQTRKSDGYLTLVGGDIIGNTNNKFEVIVGPHNTSIGSVIGSIDLSFNPKDIECARGLYFSLSVGNDIPFSLNPTCDALFQGAIKQSFSHKIAGIEVPLPEIPIDPAGIFRLGAKIGAVLNVGTDLEAGLKLDENAKPINVYASIRPYISGNANVKGYAKIDTIIKSIEKGAQGNLTLINAGTKAYVETGLTKKDEFEVNNPPQLEDYRLYTRLKWDASVKGGNGSIGLYCDVKLFGFASIFHAKTDLVSWSPIYNIENTIYDKTSYL